MRVAIIYVFPQVAVHAYEPLAKRFVASYLANPPGESDHKIHVVINGGTPGPLHTKLFSPLPVEFMSHTNVGKDIGAFQVASSTVPCDLLICLGAHIHFARAGWLDHIVRSYGQFGPALYGNYAFPTPSAHIRTTNFWLPPQLLSAYPHRVGDHMRYEFEHGISHSIVRVVANFGYPCYQLTWTGIYTVNDWHFPGREDAIFLDQHTDRIPWTE